MTEAQRIVMRIRYALGIAFGGLLAVVVVSLCVSRVVEPWAPGWSVAQIWPHWSVAPIQPGVGCYAPEFLHAKCVGFSGAPLLTGFLNFPLVFVDPPWAFGAIAQAVTRPVAALVMAVLWLPVLHAAATIAQVRWGSLRKASSDRQGLVSNDKEWKQYDAVGPVASVLGIVLFLLVGIGYRFLISARPIATPHLTRLTIPEREHGPLYVHDESIRRSGGIVQFKYVLDVPTLGPMSATGRYPVNGYHSEEFDAAIDCDRRTISIQSVTAYANVAAGGNITSRYSPTSSEQAPRPVQPGKGSTWGYLHSYLCRPDAW